MYLSKPEKGFCIPVLYIKKEDLNISKLRDIKRTAEEEKSNHLENGINYNYSDHKSDLKIKEENLYSTRGEKNDRLVLDADEDITDERLKEFIVNREINEMNSEDLGVLILDGDVMEESEEKDELSQGNNMTEW